MTTPLTDAILRHALELQRLSDHDAAQAEAILRELEGDLRRLMASRSLDTAGKREVEALIREAEKAISGRYINIAGVVDTEGIVEHVAERTVNLIDQHYPFTPSMPSVQMLNALATDILIYGSPASEWWKAQDKDTASKFARIVRQGVIEGRTNEQMVRQVAGGRDEPGIMRVARHNARALVHSSVMTAANRGRWETFKKNFGQRGAGVEWLATLDSHTCPRCGALDGQKWDWEMNPIRGSKMDFHLPPLHWNCRCILSPLPAGKLDEIFGGTGLDEAVLNAGQRASSQGPVDASTTFRSFLKRQSPEFVEDVLGAKRADLYLAGKLTLNDLVTKGGRQRTLAELKAN